jgi:N-acetylglutamate synthase-like GNAT family acetyltransferase
MMEFRLRQAVLADVDSIRALIDASVRGLAKRIYTDEQIEHSIRSVFGVDGTLIADGTYFVAESDGEIVGCGGWSKRRTLFGASEYESSRDDSLLDPSVDAAKIRAFFVHPNAARQGVGTAILDLCEAAAIGEGFRAAEMMATLPGVPLYTARGYRELESVDVPLDNNESIVCIRMRKEL